jgi:PAP2 superfamily
MLHFTRRQLFSTYLCKLGFYGGLPFSSISFANGKIKPTDFVCNAKVNTMHTAKKLWFAKKTAESVHEIGNLKPETAKIYAKAARSDKNSADFAEKSDDLTGVYHWCTSVLSLIQKYQQNPLRASRILSYVQVGMHDAWTLTEVEVGKKHHTPAVCEFASHRAAALLLGHFYPNESKERFEVEFEYLTNKLNVAGSDRTLAIKTGEDVANQLMDRSWQDGAARAWNLKLRPAAFDGIWSPAFPLYAVNPTEGMAAQWQPWVKPNAHRYVPPKAALPSSSSYEREVQQVVDVSKQLTAGEAEAAKRWNLEAGSITPAGVWFQLAKEEIRKNQAQCSEGSSKSFAMCVLTDLAVAMHDAFIACWAIKFRDWSERPITAIRRTLDPQFLPLLVTPSFPSYVSGHATISAAASIVLSHHFPHQQKKYQLLAEEAANSRLWGGIHFDSDNKEGLLLGAAVGSEVLLSKQIT